MISKVLLHTRNAEVNTTATRLLNALSNYDFSADPYLTAQIAALNGNNELMKQALNESTARSLLAPLDEKRDTSFRAIYYEVQAKTLWPDATVKGAASIIMTELERYGLETTGLSYGEESATINALLEDFKKPQVADALEKIPGLNTLILQLEKDQNDFATAFLKTMGDKADAKQVASATSLRKTLVKLINDGLVVYLNAMAIAQPATYKACASLIAEIIEENNRKVRNRRKEKEIIEAN